MGDVKLYLSKCELPDREKHNSRLFVDLAENVHIHHREYRTVFSVNEFLEYSSIIEDSRSDLINYLENNTNYEESKYPTTIMIAGGRNRQLTFLKNSPTPITSEYYNCDFAIELQEEYVTDEIHIHLRDFRYVCNRETFKLIAKNFNEALNELESFEESNDYIRQKHPDREVSDYNILSKKMTHSLQGTEYVNLTKVNSFWFENILKEWEPDKNYINQLRKIINSQSEIIPIILSTESDGSHLIIDGHHRFYSYLVEGKKEIPSIITGITFKESEKIRQAEVLLKEFDEANNYRFEMSRFYQKYTAYKLNRFYKNNFTKLLGKNSFLSKLKRKVMKFLGYGKVVFYKFNERYREGNDH